MAGSTLPAARAWILAQFKLSSAYTTYNCSVSNGLPAKNHNANHVMVGKAVRTVKQLAFMGDLSTTGTLQEDYTVEIVVSSSTGGTTDGTDADLVYANCTALVDAVSGIVRADPTLGGNVLKAVPGQSEDLGDGTNWTEPPNVVRFAEQKLTIDCVAVI